MQASILSILSLSEMKFRKLKNCFGSRSGGDGFGDSGGCGGSSGVDVDGGGGCGGGCCSGGGSGLLLVVVIVVTGEGFVAGWLVLLVVGVFGYFKTSILETISTFNLYKIQSKISELFTRLRQD